MVFELLEIIRWMVRYCCFSFYLLVFKHSWHFSHLAIQFLAKRRANLKFSRQQSSFAFKDFSLAFIREDCVFSCAVGGVHCDSCSCNKGKVRMTIVNAFFIQWHKPAERSLLIFNLSLNILQCTSFLLFCFTFLLHDLRYFHFINGVIPACAFITFTGIMKSSCHAIVVSALMQLKLLARFNFT